MENIIVAEVDCDVPDPLYARVVIARRVGVIDAIAAL